VVANIIKQQHTSRRLLDVGTCVGQDLRMLQHAGVPSSTLYGTDIFAGFEHVGHSFFRDRDSFADRFFVADVFDDSDASPLNLTAGMWDVVSATMFLHQFDLVAQKRIAARLLRLLRPCKGSMLIGNNTGELVASSIPLRAPFCKEGEKKELFRQSRESMREMWEETVREYNTAASQDVKAEFNIWCEYDRKEAEKREQEMKKEGQVRFFRGDGQRRILWCVERL